jgi:ADP-heptose:LPS heptosyltransferase
LATTQFLAGDLQRAWHEYEWRWKCARFKKRPVAAAAIAPTWEGTSLSGKTLLVYGEQGIGDEVMFASCLPELIEQSAKCIVACESRLVPLFRRSFPTALVCSIDKLQQDIAKQQLGAVDFQIAAGSVPKLTRRALSDFPTDSHFLKADEDRARSFRERLDSLGPGRKIGISWKGGATSEERRRRSSSLLSWSSLLELPDAQFVSLQYGDCEEELEEVRRSVGAPIVNWSDVDPLRDVDGCFALVAALDVVVTIDNSTLHFAGALGIPTFGLVSFPSSSYWRWFGDSRESVWYPNVQLIRRRYPAEWNSVLEQVARELTT